MDDHIEFSLHMEQFKDYVQHKKKYCKGKQIGRFYEEQIFRLEVVC